MFPQMVVSAKNGESRGKAVATQPAIKVAFSDLPTMFVAAAVDVVHDQYVAVGFSASRTFSAVRVEHLIHQLVPEASMLDSALFRAVLSACCCAFRFVAFRAACLAFFWRAFAACSAEPGLETLKPAGIRHDRVYDT